MSVFPKSEKGIKRDLRRALVAMGCPWAEIRDLDADGLRERLNALKRAEAES